MAYEVWPSCSGGTAVAVSGIVLAALVFPPHSAAFLWGALLVTVLSVVAIVGCVSGARFLEVRVLTWLGLVSYGLYLWHVPFLWLRVPVSPFLLLALALAVTWISYRFIEQPIRHRFHRQTHTLAQPLGESAGVAG